MMSRAASERMKRLHKDGVLGKAQKILFDELNSRLPGMFGWEIVIRLVPSIRKKYGCKDQFYLLDVPLIVNGSVLHNFEVDGAFGHSSQEEIERDLRRDAINLKENGFATTRFTNREIFEDITAVADKAMKIVIPLLGERM